MSVFLVSHTVDILRGDDLAVVATSLPASLIDYTQAKIVDDDRRFFTDGYVAGLLDAGTDVRAQDRLRDQDGALYLVLRATPSVGPMAAFPVQCVARRIDSDA